MTSVLVLSTGENRPEADEDEKRADDGIYLLAACLDRLVRLFDTGRVCNGSNAKRGKLVKSYFTGLENITSLVLDDVTRNVTDEASGGEEEVWNDMSVVSEASATDTGANAASATAGTAPAAEDSSRSKRRKS